MVSCRKRSTGLPDYFRQKKAESGTRAGRSPVSPVLLGTGPLTGPLPAPLSTSPTGPDRTSTGLTISATRELHKNCADWGKLRMSIETGIGISTFVFHCDGRLCHRTFDTQADDFLQALDVIKDLGWSARKMPDGGWNHYCEDCTAKHVWR